MYKDAVARWKALHDSLVSSIHLYLDACRTLEETLARPPEYAEKDLLEDAIQLVSSELPALYACTNTLRASWSCLSRSQNQSTKLVPINSLPSEILGDIFLIINPPTHLCVQCVLPDYVPPEPTCLDHIMGVCSRWRRIAMDTPGLWSHIDLVAAGRWAERFKLRAGYRMKRAGNLPVELHVQDTGDPGRFDLDDDKVSDLIEFLASYVTRYRSLEVTLLSEHRVLQKSILWFLTQSQSLSILDSLSLTAQPEARLSLLHQVAIQAHDEFDRLLAPVNRLNLRRMSIYWSSAVFQNLVDLSIMYIEELLWPSKETLGRLFSSSPKLRRITLGHVGTTMIGQLLRPGHSSTPQSEDITPTVLNDLEELNLRHLQGSCAQVLSLITPGSRPFIASIQLGSAIGEEQAARSFFSNSRVTTLFIQDIRPQASVWMSQSLGYLPHLERMAISGSRLVIDPTISAIEPWPRLRTLYLINCYLASRSLFSALDANNIHTLSLWACHVVSSPDNDSIDTLGGLQTTLFERVPKLECVQISGGCPVWGWPCV